MVTHHDVPWFSHLAPEVLAETKECFERHGVLDIWSAIVRENGHGLDVVTQLWPDIEKVK